MNNEFCEEFKKIVVEFDRELLNYRQEREKNGDLANLIMSIGKLKTFYSHNSEDVFYRHIKLFGGTLYLSHVEKFDRKVVLPEIVMRDVNLWRLKTTDNVMLPKNVRGDLNLASIETLNGVKLPKKVGGVLYLDSLKTTEGLKLPESVGKKIVFSGLSKKEIEEFKRKYPLYKDKIRQIEEVK